MASRRNADWVPLTRGLLGGIYLALVPFSSGGYARFDQTSKETHLNAILKQRRFQVLALLILVAPLQYYFAEREIGGTTIRRGSTVPELPAAAASGDDWSPADERGRFVVLSFWASWCGPCKRELPSLDSLLRQLDSTDAVRFYAVNVLESRREADAYFASEGLSLPILYDTDGRIADAFGVTALPTLILIDREGKVKFVEVGYKPWAINTLAHIVDESVPGAFGEIMSPEEMIFQRNSDDQTPPDDTAATTESTS
jgi:thiol-disulfide isomerase/thioredoxin